MEIVIGTANRKKGIELAGLLAPARAKVLTLADFADAIAVVEDGATFAENAAKKAAEQARHLGRWVMADDSGLMVDRLDGAPGVLSARYAGAGATDAANNQRLLRELDGVPLHERQARFVCHIAVAAPSGDVRAESEASCRGRILFTPRGENGFGYDPLFEVVEYHRTFGELSALVKSHLSHRARAVRRLLPQLVAMVDRGELG
jgi:XTP/dITP diphosphohydrolase